MDAKRLFRWIGLYALNLLAATLGVMFGAKVFGEMSLAPIMGHQNFLAAVLKPPYPLLIAFGILAGYLSQRRWKGSQGVWVWIPMLIYLSGGIILWLKSGFHLVTALDHYFGLSCYDCRDQQQRTVPFYTTVAYALGALIYRKQRILRSEGFEDTSKVKEGNQDSETRLRNPFEDEDRPDKD